MQRRTTALYFSPTGGTRTYVRAVAAAMPHMGGEVDLTRPEERRKVHMFGADDVVVLGVPVYYGRVPEIAGAAGCGCRASRRVVRVSGVVGSSGLRK